MYKKLFSMVTYITLAFVSLSFFSSCNNNEESTYENISFKSNVNKVTMTKVISQLGAKLNTTRNKRYLGYIGVAIAIYDFVDCINSK